MRALGILALFALAGCPGRPNRPIPPAGSFTFEVGGGSLRGVAGDGHLTFAAIVPTAGNDRSEIQARRDATLAWQVELAGTAGPLAHAGSLVLATLGGTRTVADVPVRGGPGAVVVALDATTGTPRWKLALDSSEWSLITCIAAVGGDVLVGGSFSGTLRAARRVVSSAGKSDGFVARITSTGEVAWLVRAGGAGADAVQGVAAAADRIAIAGTFSVGAELLGEPLGAVDERSPYADVFVAELDARGGRTWSSTFGGKLDDGVAGVAIDGKGRIAVAATVRDTVHVGGRDVVAQGPADGVVAFWSADGSVGPAVLLGGTEFDGLRAIAASGDHVIVGGFFAGTVMLGPAQQKADGGDDAFLVALDGATIAQTWPVTGTGREEISALSSVPGGFIAAVAHTAAARVDGMPLPAPQDPMTGAALIVRADR